MTARSRRLPILFWCSVVYLIIELGFSAQLLVMAGSLITHEQLESLEIVGRSLSGIAITLFLISGIVKSALRWYVKSIAISLVTMVTVATVWFVQEMVVMGLTFSMSKDQLERAVVLTRSTALIREGHIAIPTMDLSPEALQTPSGLSFMAMFPALAISRETIDDELRPLLPNAIQRALVLDCEGPVPCLGNEDQFVTDYWPTLKAELDELYQQYDEARQPAVNPDPDRVEREAQNAWDRYQRNLRARGLDVNTRRHNAVRQGLRREGINVSDNWRLDDYAGFKRAVRAKMMRVAAERFTREAAFEFGRRDFPADLSEREFFLDKTIQERIWREQGIEYAEYRDHPPPLLTTRYGDAQLRRNLYPALVQYYSERDLANLSPETHRGPSWHRQSMEAAEGLVAVPLALAFSIIGALAHMAKVASYLLVLILPRLVAVALPSLAVLVVAVMMYMTPNSVTSTPSYLAFERSTGETLGPVAQHGLRFVIHAEKHLFPITNWIHQVILRDVDFSQF